MGRGSQKRLHIWHFDDGPLTKDEPFAEWMDEPWRRIAEEDPKRAARLQRKIGSAGLEPGAITETLEMFRSFYPSPPDPRSLKGPPGLEDSLDAQLARQVGAADLSDLGLVLVRLMACLDRGSEDEPMTSNDIALVLWAHPAQAMALYGSGRGRRNSSLEAIRCWVCQKLSRLGLRIGETPSALRDRLLRQPDLLAALSICERTSRSWLSSLSDRDLQIVHALDDGANVARQEESRLFHSLEQFTHQDS